MHGFGQMFGWAILVGAACAFVLAALTGAKTSVSAIWRVVILAVIAATLHFLASDSSYTAMAFLPMILAFCSLGLIGALPGAALGRLVRAKILKE